MIKIIAAVSMNGIIGVKTKDRSMIPWHYKEDMQFFKKMTTGHNIIMGRQTCIDIGKPLPNRKNIVVSNILGPTSLFNHIVKSTDEAVALSDIDKDIWFIGGGSIYKDALKFASEIYLTIIPITIDETLYDSVVRFPWVNPLIFRHEYYEKLSENMHVIKFSKS